MVTLPLRDVAVSLAKNAPSIEIGERLAADKPRLTGSRSSCENPQARKAARDHKSDWAPVSAMAETSAWVFEAWAERLYLAWAEVSTEMVTERMVSEACTFPFTLGEDVMIKYHRWAFVDGAMCGLGVFTATLAAGPA